MKKIFYTSLIFFFLFSNVNAGSRFGDLTELRDDRMRGKDNQWVRPHPGPFVWNNIEKEKGVFSWDKADQYVTYAQNHNQNTIATIWPYSNWEQKSCKRKKGRSPFGKHFAKYLSKPCSMENYKLFLSALVDRYDGDGSNDMPGRLQFSTRADGGSMTERLRITSAGAAIFKGGLAEKYENAGTTLGSQPNNPLSDGNVILFTGNESGNKTINFTGVHATLSNGETVSFTAILTPNNSGKITVVQVDGQAITVKWSGGSAPTAGASGQDIYHFQILKTGTGTSDYTVFGAAANYA